MDQFDRRAAPIQAAAHRPVLQAHARDRRPDAGTAAARARCPLRPALLPHPAPPGFAAPPRRAAPHAGTRCRDGSIAPSLQVWPAELERVLEQVQIPSADMAMDCREYAALICTLCDIPIHDGNLIASLHVLLTLWSTFASNQHFQVRAPCRAPPPPCPPPQCPRSYHP